MTTVLKMMTSTATVAYTPAEREPREGDLHVPSENPTRSAVVLLHGAGAVPVSPERPRLGRRSLRAWGEHYAADGILSFNISFTITDRPGPIYPDQIADAKSAVQYLRLRAAELGIDPDRILVQGHSGGARMGGNLLVTGDDPYFASVVTRPDVSDAVNGFIGFYGGYNAATGAPGAYDTFYGGDFESTDPAVVERIAKAKSIDHVANASGPVLLIHGDADRIPVTTSQRFESALRDAGKDVELIVVPGGDHGFDIDKTNGELTSAGRAVGERTVAWIRSRFPSAQR